MTGVSGVQPSRVLNDWKWWRLKYLITPDSL
jgi:hypothetical protein